MPYNARPIIITKSRYPDIWEYLHRNACLSKNLYNAALFRVRQNFTGRKKDVLTPLEQEVKDEIMRTASETGKPVPKSVLSYGFLEKLMRITENRDFFAGLPMQTAQHVLKAAVGDFTNWLNALREWKRDPLKFSGMPKMPRYKKSDIRGFTITNQDGVIRKDKDSGTVFLKLPKTDVTLPLNESFLDLKLMEIQIKPHHGGFKVILVTDVPDTATAPPGEGIAGIDLGICNIAAYVSTKSSALYKGGIARSMNQWFNKKKAHYVSILTAGHDPKRSKKSSHRLDAISAKREQFLTDHFHKVSADIVKRCIRDGVGTLVIGDNADWKLGPGMGHRSNQEFTAMPLARLRDMIVYKAERAGITVLCQEESYTSQADFLSRDFLPVYGKENDASYAFSGKRRSRLYHRADGEVLNADINGAANIARKAVPSFQVEKPILMSPEVLKTA